MKEKEIVIYFANGNHAKFKLDRVYFGRGNDKPDIQFLFGTVSGRIFVNLDTVCFIREWEADPDDDDDD